MDKDNKNTESKDNLAINQKDEDLEGKERSLKVLSNSSLLRKILFPVFIALLITLGILFSLQFIVNFKNTANNLNQNFKTNIETSFPKYADYDSKIVINGKIKFKSFPKPYILVKDVEIDNLIENRYNFNYKISQIKLYLSLKDLIQKKIIVNKIEIIDGSCTISQLNEDVESFAIKVLGDFFNKIFKDKKNIQIYLNNNTISINSKNYAKNISDILLNINYSSEKIDINGSLSMDKQALNLDLSAKKQNDSFLIDVKMDSLAFDLKSNLNLNKSLNDFDGSLSFSADNLQLFSKTLFSSSSFIYKRIIDNSNLNCNFDFSFKNNSFNVTKLALNGKNLTANGNININLTDSQPNNINFNVDNINLDNLIIKNVVNNNEININNISIFKDTIDNIIANNIIKNNQTNDVENKQEKLKNNDFFEYIFGKNISIFTFNIKNININGKDIKDPKLKFSYLNNKGYNFENISFDLPGETKLLVNNNILQLTSQNFDEFSDFVNNKVTYSQYNTKNSNSKENDPDKQKIIDKFFYSGTIKSINNRIFIDNGSFEYKDLKMQNRVEILIDSGINYIAVDNVLPTFQIDKFFAFKKIDNSIYSLDNLFKNRILFLNNYSYDLILRFNVDDLKYKDINIGNSNFIIKTSQGFLQILNANFNNQIIGNFALDITQNNPKSNLQLNISNISINSNFDLQSALFNIPYFDGLYGKILINGSNLSFKNSVINNFKIDADITNGIIKFNNFNIDGFGGSCKIFGFTDLKFNKKLSLTFDGCTANLEDLLYLFTNIKNPSGLIGFSSVLYSEGTKLDDFIKNFVIKMQFVGNGISLNGFGLGSLSSSLFKIQNDRDLLNSISPNSILINNGEKTVFEKISGDAEYSGKNKGIFTIDSSFPTLNGKTNGKFDIFTNYINISDMQSNFILLSGTLEQTIPLSLAIQTAGNTNDKLSNTINYQQINDYINSTRETFEKYEKQQKNQKENSVLQDNEVLKKNNLK